MVAWYKHDIPAWMDGTASLSDAAYRAYHVICQQIYLNEGPIVNHERMLAGGCNQSLKAFRISLKELIDAGKLTEVDGRLTNSRALLEISSVENNRKNGGKGGKKSGEVRNEAKKEKENNEADEAALPEERSLKTRLDETRKEPCADAKAPRTKQEYSEEFESKFWAPYPRSPTMSKKEAWREWMKLDPTERASACQAIDPYRKHLRSKPTLETVHACRFLSQRRFEGFGEAPPTAPAFDIRSSLV